ncbi:MAG: DUF1588 domain-containing protein [Archangium sp.]|nr:DUF1588 domain-containing protein [Archangium sp.]
MRLTLSLLAITASLVSCEGRIAGPLPEKVVSATTTFDPCRDVAPEVGTWPLQRLTSRQLERSVEAVLADTTHAYSLRLGGTDEVVNSRLRYFLASSANDVVAEGLVLAAENVSVAAVSSAALASQLQCTASDVAGQRACAKRVISTFGRRLWRRTLATSEVDALTNTYDVARTDGTYLDGVQTALHALLASPDFFLLQQPGGTSGEAAALTGTVLAERLALTLWQEGPDDALLSAAEDGVLDTAEGFDAQLNRLLMDPRANLAFADFLKHWLSPEKTSSIDAALSSATRQPQLYPQFRAPSESSSGDGPAYARALEGFFAHSASAGTGTLRTLLLDDTLVVNEAVARNLGLPAPAAGQTEVRTPETPRRRGVLGQPALLTAFGRFEASDPVHRGVFLLRQVMCRPLNPPDMMVNTTLPEATLFKTTRDRFTAATTDAACAGCHGQINPLGFSFENFDAVGAFREKENDVAVDATATLPLIRTDGQVATVDGVSDLAAVLADDAEVRRCLVRQFAAWALHRGLTDREYCALQPQTASFGSGDGAFRDLIRGVLTSPSFTTPVLP